MQAAPKTSKFYPVLSLECFPIYVLVQRGESFHVDGVKTHLKKNGQNWFSRFVYDGRCCLSGRYCRTFFIWSSDLLSQSNTIFVGFKAFFFPNISCLDFMKKVTILCNTTTDVRMSEFGVS